MDVSPFTMGIHSVNPYSHFANYSVAQYALANEELLSRLPPLSKTVDALQAYLTPWSKEHPVCIIGAGPAGLYTAMILESLNIPYRLLEASSRVGGRLFTHRFKRRPGEEVNKYDYFDVGAMRFPDTPFMKRVFTLIRGDPALGVPPKINLDLFRYQFQDDNNIFYYNSHRYTRSNNFAPKSDPFHTNGLIPGPYLDPKSVGDFIKEILRPFRDPFIGSSNQSMAELIQDLFKRADKHSMRSYLTLVIGIPGSTVNFYETMQFSTGAYDRGLADIVLESLAFQWPTGEVSTASASIGSGPFTSTVPSAAKGGIEWWCFDGGSSRLAEAMNATLSRSAETEQPVSKIAENGRLMNVYISGVKLEQEFSAVISTVPLPRLGLMDLTECSIHDNFVQWSSIREIQYGPSVKIGIRFSRPWWQDARFGISGGQSTTDLPLRTTVYPSYPEGAKKSRVLIVSYCWTQDADRMGSMIRADGTAEKALIDLVFRNLAELHNIPEQDLRDMYIEGDHFAWDWNRDPNTMGAFAFFGPEQFEYLYPYMIQPAAHEKLFFAGEALSACHAWVAGAFDSSWRAVEQLLKIHGAKAHLESFLAQWGHSEFWDTPLEMPAAEQPAAEQSETAAKSTNTETIVLQSPQTHAFSARGAASARAPGATTSTLPEVKAAKGAENAMDTVLRIGLGLRENARNARGAA